MHLFIPTINAEVTVRNILKLGTINGASIRCQLTPELRIVIWAVLVEGGDIAVATTTLAVGLRIVCIEVVAPGESSVAARNPANMRLLFGMTLHVTLEVLLALKSALAARFLALELDLLDDWGQIFQTQGGAQELLLGWLARWLAVCAEHVAIPVDWRDGEVLLILIVAGHATIGSVTAGRAQGHRSDRSGRSVRLEGLETSGEFRVIGRGRSDRCGTRECLLGCDGLRSHDFSGRHPG